MSNVIFYVSEVCSCDRSVNAIVNCLFGWNIHVGVDLSILWSLILEEIKMTMKLPTAFYSLTGSSIRTLRISEKTYLHWLRIGFYYFEDFSPPSSFERSFLTIVPLQIQSHSMSYDRWLCLLVALRQRIPSFLQDIRVHQNTFELSLFQRAHNRHQVIVCCVKNKSTQWKICYSS